VRNALIERTSARLYSVEKLNHTKEPLDVDGFTLGEDESGEVRIERVQPLEELTVELSRHRKTYIGRYPGAYQNDRVTRLRPVAGIPIEVRHSTIVGSGAASFAELDT